MYFTVVLKKRWTLAMLKKRDFVSMICNWLAVMWCVQSIGGVFVVFNSLMCILFDIHLTRSG